MNIELNRWIANNTQFSRRKATQLIKDKKVSVNNISILKPYLKISPTDQVKISGKVIKPNQSQENHIYYVINKPKGYVSSTRSDSSGSPPVTTLVREISRIYPVGRLDINSEGLMILTNDGDLTYKLTHPKSQIEKEYLVFVKGKVTNQKIDTLQQGIELKEGKTLPVKIKINEIESQGTWMSVIISEGKYRQVRRMFASVDLHVIKLTRVRIGSLKLNNLNPGEYRVLSSKEVQLLTK
jgi:pseudouridine synthase